MIERQTLLSFETLRNLETVYIVSITNNSKYLIGYKLLQFGRVNSQTCPYRFLTYVKRYLSKCSFIPFLDCHHRFGPTLEITFWILWALYAAGFRESHGQHFIFHCDTQIGSHFCYSHGLKEFSDVFLEAIFPT